MPDYRNALEIQFFGLQRSGNHSVMAWLFQQFDGPVYFFNNAKHFGNPLQDFQPHDLPNTITVRRGEGRKRQLLEIGQRRKTVLAYSYENLVLSALRGRELVPNKEMATGTTERLHRILILRDFENWLASRIRYHESLFGQFPQLPLIVRFSKFWASYAREYLGETNYLRDVPLLTLSFNRWVRDDRYRREVIESMGIKLRDNSISYVPAAGGGSSFDATRFSGRAEQMPVFDRWRYLLEEKFDDLMPRVHARNPEIGRLNERIFGVASYISSN